MNRVTDCLYAAQCRSCGIGEWLKRLFCGHGRACPPSSGHRNSYFPEVQCRSCTLTSRQFANDCLSSQFSSDANLDLDQSSLSLSTQETLRHMMMIGAVLFIELQSPTYAGSISNKLDERFCLMNTMNPTPNIIGITETWLNQNFNDSELCYNSDYCVFRNERSCKRGCGVCLIIHKFLDPSPCSQLNTPDCEIQWVKR